MRQIPWSQASRWLLAALVGFLLSPLGGLIAQAAANEAAAAADVPCDLPVSGDPPASDTLALNEAAFTRPFFRRAEEVVLNLFVDARVADVGVDLSAVDSHFRASAVTAERLGTAQWVVRYRLSHGNTRKAGNYPVFVRLTAGRGADAVTRRLLLTYLPGGPGEISVPEGSFLAGPLPLRRGHQVLSVTTELRQRGQVIGRTGIDPTSPVELMLIVDSPRPLQADTFKLELADAGADGFWRVPVRLRDEACTRAACRYVALTTFDFVPPVNRNSRRTPALVGQLVNAGASAAVFQLPSSNYTVPPVQPTHRVSGRISFEYKDRQVDPAFSPLSPLFPWKAPRDETILTKPVATAGVRLEDECGTNIKGTTNVFGDFQFAWAPISCGMGTITVSSVSTSRRVGVGLWLNGPIAGPGELTGDTEDYVSHSWSFSFDTDAASLDEGGLDVGSKVIDTDLAASRAFYIMDNVMVARAYYDTLPGVSMTGDGPTIGVVYSPGLKSDPTQSCSDWDPSGFLGTAFYSPGKHEGFIYMPAENGCDYGWDPHAHVHETSHLFQRFFLREDPDYGRFGEGLANVQAAVIRGTQWMTGGSGLLENLDVNSRMACWLDGEWTHASGFIVDNSSAKTTCLNAGGLAAFPVPYVWSPATNSAGWFQRVAWDLVDDALDNEPQRLLVPAGVSPSECGAAVDCTTGDFDLVAGGGGDGVVLGPTAPLNDVLIYYLGGNKALGPNTNYEDRGLEGLDLVDLLDGMVCRGHATVEQVQTLYGAMGFTYDGLGPASCPHPED